MRIGSCSTSGARYLGERLRPRDDSDSSSLAAATSKIDCAEVKLSGGLDEVVEVDFRGGRNGGGEVVSAECTGVKG